MSNDHPFWPDDWKNWSPIMRDDYAKDWGFDANGDLCHTDHYGLNRWEVDCQIISATLLPDDLVWLRTIACPNENDGYPSDGGWPEYRLMSLPIYERFAANRVQAVAWNGKKWIDSRRYRWSAQMKFDTYVPPDPEVFKQIAAALMHAFEPAKELPR